MVFNINTKKIIVTTTVSFVFLASTAFAQGNADRTYTLLEPLPCIPSETIKCPAAGGDSTSLSGDKISLIKEMTMAEFFQYAFNLFVALASVAAVFMITYAGFLYVTTESWTGKGAALDKFKNAIWGLLMILGSYLLLRTINPKLVAIPTSIPAINTGSYRIQAPDLSDKLPDYSNQIHNEIDGVRANLVQQQQKISALEQQKIDIQNQITELRSTEGAEDDDPRIIELQTKLAQLQESVKSEQASSLSTEGAGAIKAEVLKNTNASSITQFLQSATAIDQLRDKYNSQLVSIGAYDQIRKINDEANYSIAMLTLLKDQKIITEASTEKRGQPVFLDKTDGSGKRVMKVDEARAMLVEDISKALTAVSGLQDPELKSKLQEAVRVTNTALNNKLKL